MPVDRQLLVKPMTEDSVPEWRCPRCSGGYLRHADGSLHRVETHESTSHRHHSEWEPEWISHRFTAMLICSNERCRDVVSVAGEGRVVRFSDYEGGPDYVEDFYPSYIEPSPPLIPLLPQYPPQVVEELQRSFIASWGDSSSAANHIRSAVERLLDHLEVRASTPRGGWIPLGQRIEDYGTRDAETRDLADALLAVKWLGNTGSHTDALTKNDVFDALDIVEIVLDDLFVNHRRRIKGLIADINENRGPLSARRDESG